MVGENIRKMVKIREIAMVNITKKCHLQSLTDVVELSLIASLIALIADLSWLMHDIYVNGLSILYILVFTGLFTGIIITGTALKRHHYGAVAKMVKQLLREKLQLQHAISRRKRHIKLIGEK